MGVPPAIQMYRYIMSQGDGAQGILDQFPAKAAYSIRQLSSSFTSPIILVRRSLDGAEQGFTEAEINDGTLTTWLNGTAGFVVTWYDQSGNGFDASIASASAQPRLANASGNLILENGLPCLTFNGTSHYLSLGGTEDAGMLGDISVFSVNKATAAGDVLVATGLTGSSVASIMQWALSTSTSNRYFAEVSDGTTEGDVFVTASSFGSQSLITMINDETANTTLFADGVAGTPVATKAPMNDANYPLEIGRDPYRKNFYFTGTMQELIMYDIAQSSNNRLDIEENIANHFGITLP